jgi:hypothetical protein
MKKPLLVAAMALVVSPILAHAQSFTTGSLALNGSNVENVGMVFDAIDLTAGEGYPTLTLNGVTFTQVAGMNGGTTGPDFTLSNLGTDGGRAGGVATTDAVYNLVNDGTYNNSGGTNYSQTLTLTGLMPGQEYAAQLFFDTGSGDDRAATVTDGSQTSGEAEVNNSTTPPSGPQFITDVFTASGSGLTTSESLVINSPPGFGEPLQFSGFVVETAPEPGTDALLGVGLIALLGLAARKRLTLSA